ncbi:hypothetical protein QAD02_002570 [Eretmocerus hayati]|uniref:Uncharacterized protein n=1 Tax=Eretmocerus hayati TaxID=131215 RepID=A0ACC2NK76_9HYME|nr:hypothetical protein QAD02_002570 [Eretmocerus hayati]
MRSQLSSSNYPDVVLLRTPANRGTTNIARTPVELIQSGDEAEQRKKRGATKAIDIFVIVSCPEKSLLDQYKFFTPLVTPFDVELALNRCRDFSFLHVTDYKEMLPGGSHHQEFQYNLGTEKSSSVVEITKTPPREPHQNHGDMVCKYAPRLPENRIDMGSLRAKSWNGLEIVNTESEIRKADRGQSGLPIHYTNEMNS